MFFVNKIDREEIIELVYSGQGFCIIVDQKETLGHPENNPTGRILRLGKKDLKRNYKKIKQEHKTVLVAPLGEAMKEQIIETFELDKIGILTYTEDYIESKKYLDRKEEIEKQTEADRIRMMKELADDYNPNGITIKE